MYNLSFKPERGQTGNWGNIFVFTSRKNIQDAISGSNPIWAGKWHSYIKKCITNRRILGTGSKHIPRCDFWVQPYLGRKIEFLHKDVYYKPTHFGHRFKTHFCVESWTIFSKVCSDVATAPFWWYFVEWLNIGQQIWRRAAVDVQGFNPGCAFSI